MWSRLLSIACLIAWSGIANADMNHQILYDQYTLQASAEGEVDNDLMMVHLQVQHEDKDAGSLAEKVNRDMDWALRQLVEFTEVEANTRDYRTYPKYEQDRVAGWRSSQTLVIQGADFEQLKEVLQVLQSRLQIQNMQFQPRDETRKKVENDLIQSALQNFRDRASIVRESMNATDYRIIQVNINTGGGRGGRARMDAQASTMMRSLESAPAVEAGQSRITVNVSGQIQLQF